MKNFVLDPGFTLGAQIFAPGKPMTFTGNMYFMEEAGTENPKWLLTQWNSRNSIRKTEPVRIGNTVIYENQYKKVALTDDGILTLRVNATEEYDKPRTRKIEPWVHLYMEQRYASPYPLKEVERMRLSFSYSVPEFRDGTPGGEPDPDNQACIVVFYIILKDGNPHSHSYGQYINFCVMLYDNRTGITPESWFMDTGQNPVDATNMMIYTMDSSVYVNPVYADGEWHNVDFDPVPYFKRALDVVQESGCMQGTKFRDLVIPGVFFGFEITGVMDSELQIKDIFLGEDVSK